jgi:hypothetical protein
LGEAAAAGTAHATSVVTIAAAIAPVGACVPTDADVAAFDTHTFSPSSDRRSPGDGARILRPTVEPTTSGS